MKLVLTGGHHSSALPLIAKIREQHQEIELFWIGHRHSLKGDKNDTLEYSEITGLKIPFFDLKTGKIYGSVNPLNYFKTVYGIISAFFYLKKIKPDLIFSFGGYLAPPVVFAGWLLKIPSITHEQTTVAGYANRFVSHFADKILISWNESRKYFPKNKIIFSGLPLRKSIFESKIPDFQSENGLPTILFMAGKSGSVKINQIIKDCLQELLKFCNIIHQCGNYSETNHYEYLADYYEHFKSALPGKYYLKKFILENEIGSAYLNSSLVVARAGAHTISEIIALEKPSLLIPLSWVSHNEQLKNAQLVKEYGLGEILLEKELTPENILNKIKFMLHNLQSYKCSSSLSLVEVSTNAPQIMINEVLKYAPKKS